MCGCLSGFEEPVAAHTVYVTNLFDSTVSVLDGASNTVTDTIGVGVGPYAVAVDPGTHTAYVTNLFDNSVSVLDESSNTVTDTIGVGVGVGPYAVAVDPSTHTAYVTGVNDDLVSVIVQTPLLMRASVAAVSPNTGPTAGGQSVTIIGSGFTGATRVLFQRTPATSFTVDSDTQITAVTPAHVKDTVQVRVHTTGLSAKNSGDRYHYRPEAPAP